MSTSEYAMLEAMKQLLRISRLSLSVCRSAYLGLVLKLRELRDGGRGWRSRCN